MTERAPTSTAAAPDASAPEALPRYVLVTPARNEAAFIEVTIRSMVAQTVPPVRWVIVSDGSTDGTDEIVQRFLGDYPWIRLVRLSEREKRNFAGKVAAFNAGYATVRDEAFDVIGNLDADTSFGPDHFAFLMDKFRGDPLLGVAGTAFIEDAKVAYNYEYTNIEHVSGQCQLFTRKCFDGIGGYVPIAGGGIDWTAVTTARMLGWKTRTFTERTFVHHRKMGTGMSGVLKARFRFGKQDYYLGSHPLWEAFRATYQLAKRPYVIGGAALYWGYLYAWLSGVKRPISAELVAFRRKEQMYRLRRIIGRVVPGVGGSGSKST